MFTLPQHIVHHEILGVLTGGGAVSGTGTVNTIAKFLTAASVGDSNITDDGTTITIATPATAGYDLGVYVFDPSTVFWLPGAALAGDGPPIAIKTGNASGGNVGGAFSITTGNGNVGGAISLIAADGFTLGGSINFQAGPGSMISNAGRYNFYNPTNTLFIGDFIFSGLTASRRYTFPDATGTVALTSGFPVGANPTALVGNAAVNGSALTFMRSDGAPALDLTLARNWSAGVHTFAVQDVHTLGVNLSTSGVIRSDVTDGASAIAYDFNDSIIRTTGFARQLRQGSTIIESVSWDGRFSFGVGAIPVLGHVLAFNVNDSTQAAFVGIGASIVHSDTTKTATTLIGVAGSVSAQTATGLSAVVINGVTGAACSNISAALAGKVLACFSGGMGQANVITTIEPTTKDINFGKNLHPAGGYDHMTVLWAPTFTTSSLTGYPADANRPGITSSARLCIQDWGGGSTAAGALGEYWAVRGEASHGATATFPSHTGFIRMTYPRRTGGTTPAVHATHAWLEPWPNTATIRGGGLAGDVYFDDGTNFSAGLYQSVVAGAYQKVLSVVTPGRVTAQTAAVASVAAFTVGASDASFEVSMNVLVTTSTLHTFNCECAYTDESNTARVLTLQFSSLAGAFVTNIANAAGAVPYEGVPLHIRCKAATTITLRTQAAGTYTTVTFNAEGVIKQLS